MSEDNRLKKGIEGNADKEKNGEKKKKGIKLGVFYGFALAVIFLFPYFTFFISHDMLNFEIYYIFLFLFLGLAIFKIIRNRDEIDFLKFFLFGFLSFVGTFAVACLLFLVMCFVVYFLPMFVRVR